MIILNCDFGNGTSNAIGYDTDTGEMVRTSFPSFFVERLTYTELNRLDNGDMSPGDYVTIRGRNIYYGKKAMAQTGIDSRQSIGIARYNNPVVMETPFYATVRNFGQQGFNLDGQKVRMVVGVPPGLILGATTEKDIAIKNQIKAKLDSFYLGQKEVETPEGIYNVEVTSLSVLAEGAGAYYKTVLDPDTLGFNTRYGKNILIIDIGRGTLDTLIMRGTEVNIESIQSANLGSDLIFSYAARMLNKESSGMVVLKEDLECYHLTGIKRYDYSDTAYKRAMKMAVESYIETVTSQLSTTILHKFIGNITYCVVTGGVTNIFKDYRQLSSFTEGLDFSLSLPNKPIVYNEFGNVEGGNLLAQAATNREGNKDANK